MTPEQIRLLYDYNSWANRRILDACIMLTDQEFARDLGSSFRSVRDTLVHIMGAEWLWLERWHGRSPNMLLPPADYPDLASVRKRWGEIERDLLRFIAGLTPQEIAAARGYRTTEGKPHSQPLWQMLQHLVNHGSYHRGQVTTMLRQLGAGAKATDLILFYRERAAQAPA